MNGLRELSNIHDLQLLCSTDAVECQFEVKLAIIRQPRLPPIFTVSTKMAVSIYTLVYIILYIVRYIHNMHDVEDGRHFINMPREQTT